MKIIAEVTYSDLAIGAIILDLDGAEWIVEERRQGWIDGVITIAVLVRRGEQRAWIKGAFGEPIAILDRTAGDAVETVGRILGGQVILEPMARKGKNARSALVAHLRHHHHAGVTGAKTDGSLEDLLAYHASLHTPGSTGGVPHIHRELKQ